ncbi:hypothetical protein [Hasllibacter sp. MH4015]|uniref:hypothetical protein n=1 Tax=Hasllibacter sp. MH4015 TaxID=2854029 RepID=UPI001CD5AC2C|nr:hypothetical protein [Hasllibacter sp. MH4015]
MRLPIDRSLRHADGSDLLRSTLQSPPAGRQLVGHGHWRATVRTLRIAGTTINRWLAGRWPSQHRLADDPRDVPEFKPFESFGHTSVSLVVLARAGDPALPGLLDRYERTFTDIVIVLDSSTKCDRSDSNVRLFGRPLDGNFAAQRNAGTSAAKGSWVFHLDTDEDVSADFCAVLPHLASAAACSGYLAVGFPRRNYVDNRLSDLFPDIQYRLIRRDVLFEGRVHERPSVCGQGDRTIVSQHGMIDHRMARDRVRARSKHYDQLGQEAARHQDDVALLSAFAP